MRDGQEKGGLLELWSKSGWWVNFGEYTAQLLYIGVSKQKPPLKQIGIMEWKRQLGVWFQTCFYFHPELWGRWTNFRWVGSTTNQPRVLKLRVSNPLQLGINSIDFQNPGWDVILSCEKLGRATVTAGNGMVIYFWWMMFNKNPPWFLIWFFDVKLLPLKS